MAAAAWPQALGSFSVGADAWGCAGVGETVGGVTSVTGVGAGAVPGARVVPGAGAGVVSGVSAWVGVLSAAGASAAARRRRRAWITMCTRTAVNTRKTAPMAARGQSRSLTAMQVMRSPSTDPTTIRSGSRTQKGSSRTRKPSIR
ncbi:hypothetical protein GCM10020256_02280 [Streptomyces thermocoprophilus]